MHTSVQIRLAYWPVAVVDFGERPRPAAFDAYLSGLSAIAERREPYALVLNAEKIGLLPAALRRRQSRWMREHAAALREHCVGASWVLSSAVTRLVHRAMVRLDRLACPYRVCDSYAEAILWSGERLQAADVSLPVGLLGHTVRAPRA